MQPYRAAVADTLAPLQAAAGATGNGTALDVKGWDGVLFQVTGSSPSATITFEGSADDGTTWVSLEAYNIANGTVATTATAVGDFVSACAGLSNVRARVSAWTSGTFTVGARAFPGAAAAALVGSSATSGGASNVNVAQINGVTPLMGTGNTGTGSPRVTIATDQAALTTPLPVNMANQTAGTFTNTADATVAGTSATVLPSNASRKYAFIQNVGTANIRVGTGTVTASTGLQLVPGATLILEAPFCPTAAITAIRETSTSSTVAVAEVA